MTAIRKQFARHWMATAGCPMSRPPRRMTWDAILLALIYAARDLIVRRSRSEAFHPSRGDRAFEKKLEDREKS